MPSKIKKLYHKAKKGWRNTVTGFLHKREHKLETKEKELSLNKSFEKKLKKSELSKKSKKLLNILREKAKPPETLEKDSVGFKRIRNSFKKVKEKIRNLKTQNPKKKKIISSKKLALLLTATTIVALLPMFHLTPLTVLATSSTCVFTINFIMVKTLKKFLKHHKLAREQTKDFSKLCKPEEMKDISVKPVQKEKHME